MEITIEFQKEEPKHLFRKPISKLIYTVMDSQDFQDSGSYLSNAYECDIMLSEKLPEDYEKINKNQYIIINTGHNEGLWYFSHTTNALYKLNLLEKKQLSSLSEKLKLDENKPASKEDLQLIRAYIDHSQACFTRLEKNVFSTSTTYFALEFSGIKPREELEQALKSGNATLILKAMESIEKLNDDIKLLFANCLRYDIHIDAKISEGDSIKMELEKESRDSIMEDIQNNLRINEAKKNIQKEKKNGNGQIIPKATAEAHDALEKQIMETTKKVETMLSRSKLSPLSIFAENEQDLKVPISSSEDLNSSTDTSCRIS